MQAVDLHTHSNKSDGSFSPTELVDYAVTKKLCAVALTDHDIDRLKKSGTFVNGRYVNITQCNLVRKESNEEQAAGPENY